MYRRVFCIPWEVHRDQNSRHSFVVYTLHSLKQVKNINIHIKKKISSISGQVEGEQKLSTQTVLSLEAIS